MAKNNSLSIEAQHQQPLNQPQSLLSLPTNPKVSQKPATLGLNFRDAKSYYDDRDSSGSNTAGKNFSSLNLRAKVFLRQRQS